MNDKIMAGGNLDDILDRLNSCLAVFRMIQANMSDCEAMSGACDLLQSILKDFLADIEGADDYEA